MWPLLMREKTVVYEQDRRHIYALIGPRSPAKDYRAELLLTPTTAGGTDVRWTGSFAEGLRGTGPVMLIFLRGVVRFLARRLVKAAERDYSFSALASTPCAPGEAISEHQVAGEAKRPVSECPSNGGGGHAARRLAIDASECPTW